MLAEGFAAPTATRVVRVIARLNVGGPALNACLLTAHLDQRRFHSWLVCGRPEQNEAEDRELATSLNINPIYLERMKRRIGTGDFGSWIRLGRIYSELRPHIVHTHTAKAGALGRSIGILQAIRGYRPRLVHTFHGHVFRDYFSSPATYAFIAVERLLAAFSDAVITVSPQIKRELVEVYRIAPRHKVRVIRLGFDFKWLERLKGQQGWLRGLVGADDSTVLIGIVGRLTAIKNHGLALRAFARLRSRVAKKVCLVIFGGGELRVALEALACELGIKESVIFLGWQPDRASIYSDLDLICLPSRNEGTPVVLIESLAAGVPVVATRVGGVVDVVDEAADGELVESEDQEAMASALARLVEKRPRLTSERRSRAKQKYSVQRLIAETENLYGELLHTDPITQGNLYI